MSVRLVFGCDRDCNTELECYVSYENQIYIGINDESSPSLSVSLNLNSAIKFSKELRRQISILKQEGVCNG